MKAQVRTDALGDITIGLEGGLDYENNAHLKRELEDITQKNPDAIITLDLHKMDFVGSCGIGVFVGMLKDLNEKHGHIKLANVKAEFLKVFKIYGPEVLEALICEFEHDETENLNQRFGGRRRTFQN